MSQRNLLAAQRYLPVALLISLAFLTAISVQAQQGPTTIRLNVHHDVSPPLRDLIKYAPPASLVRREVEPLRRIPLPPGLVHLEEDPLRQRSVAPALTPLAVTSFEGLGQGQYGFTITGAPPDTNGAVGATQYVQWVNTSFAIFSKSGALLAGPTAGNTLWSGFGGGCQNNNDGDPIVLYDKLANRWVMSQFSVSTTPYLQCIAVSTTSDATGTWNRYSFQYTNFDDYPKMGVWPDAYYETFNMFAGGTTFVGSDACAYDRNAMLAGTAATQVCFQQSTSVGGLLPSDVDGITSPPSGSPNYMLYFGTNSLNLYKFHVDFVTPANSTFTGPTVINVAAFSPLCNGGTCVPQPGTTNTLDSLADRLMYRLAYRNFGNHESLVVNHSVAVSGSGGVRWYEIQNPSGTPSLAQQGTYSPDSTYRWMGSVAMDQAGNLAVGYSESSSSTFPSIAIAGRLSTDPSGTLQAETPVVSGTGSETAGLTRWGDYSAMTVDPTDDCTFWYTQEYIKTNGTFNWSTRIANFKFAGCGTGGGSVTLNPSSLNFGNQALGTTSAAQTITLNNNQSVSLTITSIVASGDYAQANNCGTTVAANGSCTINVTFTPTVAGTRTGSITVTDNGPGNPQTASLTGVGVSSNCIAGTLSNGGFETGNLSCWTTGGVYTPFAATVQKHSGSYSAQLGASVTPEPNGDSSLYQTINVPSGSGKKTTLTFWYWPSTTDTITYDWQEAQIRNTSGTTLAQVFKVASNTQAWTQVTFDLTPYAGQSVQLYFNVHGDGYGDLTYMYLDDVSVTTTSDTTAPTTQVTAPTNGATVSGTVTVTATGSDVDNPILSQMQIFIDGSLVASNTNANSISYSWDTTKATNATHTIYSKAYDAAGNVGTSTTITVTVNNTSTQLIQNGGFETGTLSNWSATGVALPFVVTGHAHTGTYSAQLGASSGTEPNGNSSLYQTITIPSTATTATLTFYYWPSTTDTITYDWQEAQVQNTSGATLAQIMKVCSNAHAWTQVTYNLIAYKGQTIRIYFNTHQDGYGDLTYMYLDDVSVSVK